MNSKNSANFEQVSHELPGVSESNISETLAKPKKQKTSKPVQYNLRPAKNIERKMMAEAFHRMNRLAPLSTYRYVGMGSEFFNDFALFHQTLGISSMISMERDEHRIDRCKFNLPYSCIKVEHGLAGEVLSRISWDTHSIVWLDYTEKLNRGILEDLRFLIAHAPRCSVLVWSVNAETWGDDEGGGKIKASDLPEHRLKKLKESVGSTTVPSTVKGSDLALWGLAGVFRDIIIDEINVSLNNRNASAAKMDRLEFRQFLNFRYKDGLRMLTVGGVLLNETDQRVLGDDAFRELFFVREGADAFEIEPPMLTSRELRHLNKQMPDGPTDLVPGLTPEEIENYKQVYRYYPVFAEAEL